MKRFMMSLLVFVCCLTFMYGSQRIVGANWDVKFTCPGTANDFHINIDLMSANNIKPQLYSKWIYAPGAPWTLTGLTITQDISNPLMWHAVVDFRTTGSISTGTLVHFGIEFLVENYNYIRLRMAYWTRNGQYLCPAPLLGFHVWERIVNGIAVGNVVTLFNDTDEPMVIEQLEFAVTSFHVPLQDMFYSGLGAPGDPGKYPQLIWVPAAQTIQIAPKQIFEIDLNALGVILNVDEFLQFKANVNGIPQWFQHQQ